MDRTPHTLTDVMAHTILVVDDNDAFRGMLSTVLSMRGYQTLVARSGTEGLQLAGEYEVDAALVDVEMPDMDGFEFCRKVRELTKTADGKEVPVWIMTGVMRLGLNRKAEAAGALIVLRKPLNVDETCAQFEAQFKQRAGQQ